MRYLLLGAALVVLVLYVFSTDEEPKKGPMINGVSLVSPPQKISPKRFQSLVDVNANWVALIPFGFSRKGEPEVSFNHSRQWWGERTDGTKELAKCSRDYGLKVMLKPHVWIMGQGWPGEYDLQSEDDWEIWERTYREYIMTYAHLADSIAADLFCIGTEFRFAGVKREKFWRELAREVRTVYKGEITYASNWDNFEQIKFWDELDYIGVDAYFPLTDSLSPSVREIEQGWSDIKQQLRSSGAKYDKPILFTEYGYQSLKGAAGKHWEVDKSQASIDMDVQANAYEALFNVFWEEKWFAGGFLWKWHLKDDFGGPLNPNFTPQGKAAEKVIRNQFSTSSSQ